MSVYLKDFENPFGKFIKNSNMYYLGVDSQQRFFVIEKKSWYICFLRALQPFLQLFDIDAFAQFRSRHVIQEVGTSSMNHNQQNCLETFLKIFQCFEKKNQENDPTQKLLSGWIDPIKDRIREIGIDSVGEDFVEEDFNEQEEDRVQLVSINKERVEDNSTEFSLPSKDVLLKYLENTSLDELEKEVVVKYCSNQFYPHIYDFMVFLHEKMGLYSLEKERECFQALFEASRNNTNDF